MEILNYCFLVVGVLFGASIMGWHYMRYRILVKELDRNMRHNVMYHERVWNPEDERDGRRDGPP